MDGDELSFQKSLDPNYLTVLSQQDRMVRQFYPEMIHFLSKASKLTTDELEKYFEGKLSRPKLLGKFINSSLGAVFLEADRDSRVRAKDGPIYLSSLRLP